MSFKNKKKASLTTKKKIKLLSNNHDKWFFVVTNPNKVAKYREYGKTVDLRYLRRQLTKIIKTENSHSA